MVAALASAVLIAACGSGDESGSEAEGGSTAGSVDAAACPGEPIRLTTVSSLSGPLTFGAVAAEVTDGTEAAVQAVNSECALGRPLQVDVCDDRSDPNESTRCGREAAESGSLALFSDTGLFDEGATASELPAILTAGNTLFDLTNEQSFPAGSGITLVLGSVSAAAAAGVDDYLMVSLDTAAFRAFVEVCQEVAEQLGINMEALWYPADTTDFAPVAAQIAEHDPDAIGLIVESMVPFVNALAAEGISAEELPIFTSAALAPPQVIDQLGDKADGAYLITQQVPPSATENPGIQQMLDELEAAGFDADNPDLSPTSVYYWSNVHALVDILRALPPEEIAALDSQALVRAVEAAAPIERPEIAPIDFSAPAFAEFAPLADFRLFSRQAMVVHVEDGQYVPVSPFGDVTEPFDMEF